MGWMPVRLLAWVWMVVGRLLAWVLLVVWRLLTRLLMVRQLTRVLVLVLGRLRARDCVALLLRVALLIALLRIALLRIALLTVAALHCLSLTRSEVRRARPRRGRRGTEPQTDREIHYYGFRFVYTRLLYYSRNAAMPGPLGRPVITSKGGEHGSWSLARVRVMVMVLWLGQG